MGTKVEKVCVYVIASSLCQLHWLFYMIYYLWHILYMLGTLYVVCVGV